MRVMSIAGRVLALAVTFLKWLALAFVFMRFHGTWVGLTVVVLMGILLFRVDLAVWRFAKAGFGGARES